MFGKIYYAYNGIAPHDPRMEPYWALHDRMPAVLHPSEFSDWLNPDNQSPDFFTDFLRPYPDDGLGEYFVGSR